MTTGVTIDSIYMPVEVERGMVGGPAFFTNQLRSANAVRTPVINWPIAMHRWNLSVVGLQAATMLQFKAFFMARRGPAYGFLFKDWNDYTSGTENLGTGNAVITAFPLTYTYADAIRPYIRNITRPRLTGPGTLQVFKNGVLQTYTTHYTFANGVVTFVAAPANGVVVTATFQFDVPVTFADDTIPMTTLHEFAQMAPSFGIEEVNEYAQL